MAMHRDLAEPLQIVRLQGNASVVNGRGKAMGQSESIYLVDDDPAIRDALGLFLEREGYNVMQFSAGSELLDAVNDGSRAVIVLDHYLGDMSGLEVQAELNELGMRWPVILMSGSGDIALSVKAMKAGALDFLEKPVSNKALLSSVASAFEMVNELDKARRFTALAQQRCSSPSEREREVMALIVSGMPNNKVAQRLDLSIRTIEVHRANINKKMGANTLVELVHMADLCPNCRQENQK